MKLVCNFYQGSIARFVYWLYCIYVHGYMPLEWNVRLRKTEAKEVVENLV